MALEQLAVSAVVPADDLIERLATLCRGRGLERLGDRIALLGALAGADLAAVEHALGQLPHGPSIVLRGASHLLDLGGKRLRPLCVALAARAGNGFSDVARELAVAVELVHSATLLHDDVVDDGDVRRGAATARRLYGNAASIFAGDWLLVEALRRVRETQLERVLERLLSAIAEMILAESAQLENRGRLNVDRALYLHIVEGKTAALFRWAMFAGASAGGLDEPQCRALERFGLDLGVAFQAIDDLLDFSGATTVTGKALFADLREGKMTYPLILAAEREPELRPLLSHTLSLAVDESEPSSEYRRCTQEVLATLLRTDSLEDCRSFAELRAQSAIEHLRVLPESAARAALETVAAAAVDRDR